MVFFALRLYPFLMPEHPASPLFKHICAHFKQKIAFCTKTAEQNNLFYKKETSLFQNSSIFSFFQQKTFTNNCIFFIITGANRSSYNQFSTNSLNCRIFPLEWTLNSRCSKSRFFMFRSTVSATFRSSFFRLRTSLIPLRFCKKSIFGLT